MKVVILAGGLGTRITEESHLKPKPMIEIGGLPILWHIMKIYSHYGFNEFIICCGYKQHVIKEYFADYYLHRSDVTFDFSQNNKMIIHNNISEPWKVTLVDTGLYTNTGGRIKRIRKYLDNETFCLTYGDGVSDVNIAELVEFHKKQGKLATITTIKPEGRFGVVELDGTTVQSFREKDRSDTGWINCGFMVMEPEVIDFIEHDDIILEREPLEKAVELNQLNAYRHEGFWHCMDTLRDKLSLDRMWEEKNAPWKVWEDR